MASSVQQTFSSEEDGKQLVLAVSKFALQLYKEQGKRTQENIFMSPMSIATVLNMACLGARGKTLEEMKATLCWDHLEDSKLHQAFNDLLTYINKASKEVTKYRTEPIFSLFMANRLYAEKSYPILEEFQTACKKHYDAELKSVSFTMEADKAAAEINSWVSECTNEKITNIISPDFIDENTRLILVNAIYFKSKWYNQFKKELTKEEDFFVTSEEIVKTKMMFQKMELASYCSSSDLMCEIIKLPYLSYRLTMFVLLPHKSSSLEELEERLTADHLVSIDTLFQERPDVNLWLPKFRIDEKLNLKEILQTMGMSSLFTRGSSDLSGIDGTKELYAEEVVHKAFVDVNEEGTEAAAATAMKCSVCCVRIPPEPVDLRVDRPFLFFIREEKTSMILFLGRLIRP